MTDGALGAGTASRLPEFGIVGDGGRHHPAAVDHDTVGLGPRDQLVHAAGVEGDKTRRHAGFETAAGSGEAGDRGGQRADEGRRLRDRMIEVQDAHGLPERIDHVVVAVGVEAVAAVVAGGGDGDPALAHLAHERDAPPARCASGHAVLQVHVHRWQRDNRDAGLCQQVERRQCLRLGLHRETAAVAAGDAPGVTVAQRGTRHVRQRVGVRVAALVHVQVDVEVVARGERKQAVQHDGQVRLRDRLGAEG